MSEIQVGQINSTDGSTAITVSSGNTTLGGTLTTGGNIDASSHGIYLGANASSNLLDDYETGTWTPTIAGDSGTEALRSGNETLSYTKIGNLVHVRGKLETISAGGATGGLKITSLPFVSASGTSNSEFTATWVLLRDYGSTLNQVMLATFASDTNAYLYHVDNSGTLSSVDASEVDTAFELWLSITYPTDA